MLINTLLADYLEKTLLKGSNWIIKALIVIVLCSICINFGFDLKRWAYIKNFVNIASGGTGNPQLCCYFWSDIAYQTTDILMQRLQVWDTVHQANMRFRLLLPGLWMAFHSVLVIYLIQIVLGIGQMYMALLLAYRITEDRVQAFYFTLGFAGLYSGAAYYLDFYGYGDAFAYIFMMAALYFRKPLLISLSIFLAALVDERALFDTSLILLFHWVFEYQDNHEALSLRRARLNAQQWAILLAGLIYMAVRIYLTLHFELKTPYGGPDPFFFVKESLKGFGIRLWSGFEGFWILMLMMIFVLYYRRLFRFFWALILLIGITVFTFLLQGDFTRTAAFAFPFLFVALTVAKSEFPPREMQLILLIIALISGFFFPVWY